MEYFRARISELRGFTIGNFRQYLRVRHNAWIGRHDPVDIGPDPEFTRTQRSRQNQYRENPNRPARAW